MAFTKVRSQVNQILQVGLEAAGSEGVFVAPTKRIIEAYGMPRIRMPQTIHRPANSRYAIDQSNQHEFSELPVTGYIGFNTVPYFLAAMFGVVVGNAFTWKPAPGTIVVPQTLSVQHGNSVANEQLTGAFTRDFDARFTRSEASFRAALVGLAVAETGNTWAEGATDVPKVTGDYKDLKVYMGDTVAGLALLTKSREASFGIRNWQTPAFYLGTDGYSELTDRPPDLGASVTIVHDATSKALIPYLRTRTTRFLRIKWTGPEWTPGSAYTFQFTCPFKFPESDRGENDGAVAATYPLHVMYDSTFGAAFEVLVSTDYAGL